MRSTFGVLVDRLAMSGKRIQPRAWKTLVLAGMASAALLSIAVSRGSSQESASYLSFVLTIDDLGEVRTFRDSSVKAELATNLVEVTVKVPSEFADVINDPGSIENRPDRILKAIYIIPGSRKTANCEWQWVAGDWECVKS